MKKIVVIHYGEIAIKGENRIFFEKQLIKNIKRALHNENIRSIERLRGRIIIHLYEDTPESKIKAKLITVFGVSHFSLGVAVGKDIEVIKETAWHLLKNVQFGSFKIETRRAQKEFALTSTQINQEVGTYIQERCGKKVDLTNPEATVYIEIAGTYALLYTKKIPGLRGLPVGVSEKAVSLLSSGIDSPVSSYLMMKRGVKLIYVHFHSQPFTSKASQENTEKLVKVLNRYQDYSKIYFIPFIEIQKEIMARARSQLRVLLYRRYMVRLAERVAKLEKARALVTGENVGQVASQTLSNLRVVGEVTSLPILRPLAGYDKEEIVQLAQKIGTFEVSIQPYEDCCSLFVPDHPATKAHPKSLFDAEKRLAVGNLMDDAMVRAEIKIFKSTAINYI